MPTSSPKLLDHVREEFCYACGAKQRILSSGFNLVAPHHIQEKGMGNANGGDDFWNLIPLCKDDHTDAPWAWHRNLKAFLTKYPHVKSYLHILGWEALEVGYKIKLIHPAYVNLKPKEKPVWTIKLEHIRPFLGRKKTDHMEDQ